MSISTVVTRGYGSFGTIAAVVTRGFFPDAVVVQAVSRGDYGATEEEYQAQLRRNRKRLKQLQKRKEEDKKRLRKLIREAVYGPEIAEEAQELLEAIPAAVIAPHQTAASSANVERLEVEIEAVHSRIAELETKLEAHRAEQDEEDDIEALLLLAA
jgi:DNA repair exonuclease SbcCD ATPase subunit